MPLRRHVKPRHSIGAGRVRPPKTSSRFLDNSRSDADSGWMFGRSAQVAFTKCQATFQACCRVGWSTSSIFSASMLLRKLVLTGRPNFSSMGSSMGSRSLFTGIYSLNMKQFQVAIIRHVALKVQYICETK